MMTAYTALALPEIAACPTVVTKDNKPLVSRGLSVLSDYASRALVAGVGFSVRAGTSFPCSVASAGLRPLPRTLAKQAFCLFGEEQSLVPDS